MNKKEIAAYLHEKIESKRDKYIQAADEIWSHPELYYRERKSAAVIEQLAKKEGFQVSVGQAGLPTAVVGEWGSGKPIIGFLGEFDALPGLSQEAGCSVRREVVSGGPGHGCGHNLLGVGALAAASAFREYLRENHLKGTVRFYGCPAEEDGSGKMFMAREGLFDDLDLAITWHPSGFCSVRGIGSNAVIGLLISYKGISAHAAGSPHLGRSALDAAELTSVGVNYLREHVIQEARIHYAYQDVGGAAPNVVQDHAAVKYFVRAPKIKEAEEIAKRVKKIAEGAALMTETEADVRILYGMHEYVPNDAAGEMASEAMKYAGRPMFDEADFELARKFYEISSDDEILSSLKRMKGCYKDVERFRDTPLITETAPYRNQNRSGAASTDVGCVTYCCPTVWILASTYAVGTLGHHWKVTAQVGSSIGHKGMLYAAEVMAMTGVVALNDPVKLKAAHDEWVKKTGGKYICPAGSDVRPLIPET